MSRRFNFLRSGIVGHSSKYAYELCWFDSLQDSGDGLAGDGLVSLRDIAADLDRLHSDCTCGRTVTAARVLKVDLQTAQDIDTALEDFNADDGARDLQVISHPHTLVKDLFPADAVFELAEGVQLLFTTVPSGPPIPFTGVRRLGMRGNVCRVSGSTIKLLPGVDSFDYKDIASRSGTHFIDKSDFLCLRYHYDYNHDDRVPIVLREAGYGKTVFCTMLEAYFLSYEHNWRTKAPTRFPIRRFQSLRGSDYRGVIAMLVDFDILVQRLPAGCEQEHDEIMDACTGFITTVIAEFYEKSSWFLGENRPAPDDAFMHTFEGLKILLARLGFRLLVIIDNFTAPFIHVSGTSVQYLEYELWLQFISYVVHDLGGFIWRAFITGRPMHGHIPFSDQSAFVEKTEDISNKPESLGAIGFSREEMVDFAAIVCGDSAANLGDKLGSSDAPPDGTLDVYPAKTVVAVLKRLLDGDPLDEILSDELLVPTTLSTSTSTESQESEILGTPGGFNVGSEPGIVVPENESFELSVEAQGDEHDDSPKV